MPLPSAHELLEHQLTISHLELLHGVMQNLILFISLQDDILKNYQKLDDLDIIPNAEAFECIICYIDIEPGDGVVLRECLHTFCK